MSHVMLNTHSKHPNLTASGCFPSLGTEGNGGKESHEISTAIAFHKMDVVRCSGQLPVRNSHSGTENLTQYDTIMHLPLATGVTHEIKYIYVQK